MTNKNVTAKYGVPKNTLSTWVKNKHQLANSLEKKEMFSSRKSTCCGSYNQTDKAVFHWFVGKRLLGSYWKKALEFAKKMGIKKFKASDCCVNKWKKRCEHNNSFLFAFFYTALKIFTKNFHHFS